MNVVVFRGEWPPPPVRRAVPGHNAGHVRPRPGLVEKDQPFGNQPRLLVRQVAAPPRSGPCSAAWAVFFCDAPERRKSPSRSPRRPARRKARGDVAILHHQARCDAMGSQRDFFQPPYLSALIVPRCFQRCISFTTKLMLTSNCRRRIAEVPDSTTRNSFTKIFRIRSCHPGLASFNPARLNHFLLGIPFLICLAGPALGGY